MSKERLVNLVKEEFYFRINPDNSTRSRKRQLRRKTVAGMLMQDNSIRIGVTECSFEDQYTKVKGRGEAKAKALRAPQIVLSGDTLFAEGTTGLQRFLVVAKQLTGRNNTLS